MRMDKVGRAMTGALRGVAVAAVLGLGLTAASGVHAQDFETPSNRQASQILPANLISGPYHRVRETVVSYGYMHHYTVDSQFGVFEATGDGALRKLVNEMYAIASLKEFKTGEAFLTAVGNAAKAPVNFGKNLITNPVDTVSGIPQGVFSIFGNVVASIPSKSFRLSSARKNSRNTMGHADSSACVITTVLISGVISRLRFVIPIESIPP